MKKTLVFSAALAATVAALAWPGNADPTRRARINDGVSSDDVLANIRASGLAPTGRVVRRGDYFILHAIDPRGNEVRVIADALFGDVLSVTLAQPLIPVYGRYDAGPRIIHVPDKTGNIDGAPGRSRASLPDDDAAAPDDDEVTPPPPARRQQAVPVPEPKPRRSVLSVPPPAVDGPTPLKPTPRWRAIDKFSAPSSAQPGAQPSAQTSTPPAAQAPAEAAPSDPAPMGRVPVPNDASLIDTTAAGSLASAPGAAAPDTFDTPPDGPTLDPIAPAPRIN